MGLLKIFGHVDDSDYQSLVQTHNTDTFIRVIGFKEENNSSVYIENLFTNFSILYRIKKAWKVLLGKHTFDIEILCKQELSDLIVSMEEVRDAIFIQLPKDSSLI